MATEERENPILRVARAAELTDQAAAKAKAAVEELHRASLMATMVARVATAVAQSMGVSDLAEAVLDQTIGALGAAACSIFVADTEKRELHLVRSRHVPPEMVREITRVSFDAPGAPSRTARACAMEVIEDVSEQMDEQPVVREFLLRIGTRRLISLPLVSGKELVGVLAYILTGPRASAAEDFAALDVVASIVGVGFSNALAKERLAHERARLATIVEHAPHGIVYMDVGQRRTTANPAAASLLNGGESTAPFDRPPIRIYRPDGRLLQADEEPAIRAIRGETVAHEEVLIEDVDGRRRPMLISAAPVPGPRGNVDGVVVSFQDISVLKELDRLREEFAAIVAHDLRNPISAILMSAQIMLADATGDHVEVPTSALARIRCSAARLGEMVKDLLDTSRIEAGQLALELAPIDTAAAVREIVSRIQPTLGEHPVELDTGGTHAMVTADLLRFEQLFTNLLENAAKYSPGDAPIVVRLREQDGGVVVSIIDRGIGVPPGEQPLLFDRFYQAKRARKMRKGLGLGLYITKELVRAHGGRITVESEPGKGSAFHVWLPCTTANASKVPDLAKAG